MAQPQRRISLNLPREALFFVLVGASAAGVHFLLLWFWVQGMGWRPLMANVAAFCGAFIVSFLGHLRLTFSRNTRNWRQSLWRWWCSSIAAFAGNQLLFALALAQWGEAYYRRTWFAVTLIITLAAFFLGKYWAFKETR